MDLQRCLFCEVDYEIGNGLCSGCDDARLTLPEENASKIKMDRIVRDIESIKHSLQFI